VHALSWRESGSEYLRFASITTCIVYFIGKIIEIDISKASPVGEGREEDRVGSLERPIPTL
jgi:hypothetical protein